MEEVELSYDDICKRAAIIKDLKDNEFKSITMENCSDAYYRMIANMINNPQKTVLIKQKYIKTKKYEWIPTNIPEIIR